MGWKSRDVMGTPLELSLTADQKRSRERDKIRNKKIERLSRDYGSVDEDTREEWVNEDLEQLDFDDLGTQSFLDELSSLSNMDTKITGTRWYHHDRRIGRIWKSIHERNFSDNTATIILFRNGDKNVYRFSVPSGKEAGILYQAIQNGYTLSRIKVAYGEID